MQDDDPKEFELPEDLLAPSPASRAIPASGEGTAAPADDRAPASAETDESRRRFGAALAEALYDGGYHPVILFGTSASGKTSLLLSLFSLLSANPALSAGLALGEPLLGLSTPEGRLIHRDAKHTFEVKTQAFAEGERIPKTNADLPFFIPVEFRPAGKPSVRLAFLESVGEWYRPRRERGQSTLEQDSLFKDLRLDIEEVIASFQGPISFIYLAPYTQLLGGESTERADEGVQLRNASLAIKGVLEAYDRTRISHRAEDRHLMLVTKWDVRSARDVDRARGIVEDRNELNAFLAKRYNLALTAFQTIGVEPSQKATNAYCAGVIDGYGLLQLRGVEDVQAAVSSYPLRLWKWLYHNGLRARDEPLVSPFPEPPSPSAASRLFGRLLDLVAG